MSLFITPIDVTGGEQPLHYFGQDDKMATGTILRLRNYVDELLADALSPADLALEWPAWFELAPSFVQSCGCPELERLESVSDLLGVLHDHGDAPLSAADWNYLRVLAERLGQEIQRHVGAN